MKRVSNIFLIIVVVIHTFSQSMVVQAQELTPPNNTDDSGLAVDVTADCRALTEDQPVENKDVIFPPLEFVIKPLEGEWPPLIHGPGPTPTYPLGHIDWKLNSFTDFLDYLGFATGMNESPPDLTIATESYGVNEGDPITIMALPTGFVTAKDRLAYGWWTVTKNGDKEVLYSLNGVVAGGDAFPQKDIPIDNGSRCGIATRRPLVDSDRDGMDDQWELRYAKHGDISGFKPGKDDDQDGYNADSFLQNETGEAFAIAPDSEASNGTKFSTGDGQFTNLEEYIWGTNPLDPDTDDDGFPDEADVAGIGQVNLHYLPPEVNGQSQTIQLDVMGESGMAGKDEVSVTQIAGYRVNLPTLIRQNLTVLLSPSTPNPQLGETFRVDAETSGTNADPGNLRYRWEISNNGVPIPVSQQGAPCKYLGFNNAVECTFQAGAFSVGNSIAFKVTAYDPRLNSQNENTLNVPIGGAILIVPNPTLVPQYPIDQTGENYVSPEGNIVVGERWIELTANLTEGIASDYVFDWYVDDEKIVNYCAKAPLVFTGRAVPQGGILCGVGTNILYFHATQNNAHTYEIRVKVNQKTTGSAFADESIKLFTDPTPAVYPGQVAITDASTLLQTNGTLIQPNQDIVVSAKNLESSDTHSYEYIWTVDGEVVSKGSKHQLAFTAMPQKQKYEIQLQVVEREGTAVVSQKTATTVVAVDSVSKYEMWRDSRLASVQSALYPLYHTMAGNTSLFLVVAGFVVILSVYVLQKKEKLPV